MARTVIATDTFDTSISASWQNGISGVNLCAWASGGYVQAAALSSTGRLYRTAETYPSDQYSKVIYKTVGLGATGAETGAFVRASTTTAQKYPATVQTVGAIKYSIYYANAAGALTTLASGGTPSVLAAGDSVITEISGTGIRLYSDESGSGDVLRLSTTDTTITSGVPGFSIFIDGTLADVQVTAWEGGSVSSGSGARRSNFLSQPMLRGPM